MRRAAKRGVGREERVAGQRLSLYAPRPTLLYVFTRDEASATGAGDLGQIEITFFSDTQGHRGRSDRLGAADFAWIRV